MKKLTTLILALALILAPAAMAEIDLSGMSFDELVDLQYQLNMAIWASDGWQEVEVPAGTYYIGVDIPEGRWTISSTGSALTSLLYSDETGSMITDMLSADESINWALVDGTMLVIEWGSVKFTPYIPSFSFK